MQALYKFSLEGSPRLGSSVAPAVGAIDAAVKELIDSRTPTQKLLFQKILQKKKQLLQKEADKAGVLETAYVLIHELERMRVANIYGIDTVASHTSFVIYTLYGNYRQVFDTLSTTFNKGRADSFVRRLRNMSL